jgi:hypothetical protein
MIELSDDILREIANMSSKEYYDFCQSMSKARGYPAWTTWQEYYNIIDERVRKEALNKGAQ